MKFFGVFFRCLVGGEYGFTGEGNEQWYYILALVMNSMLAWMYLPEIALTFTILSIVHLIGVGIYGYNDLGDESKDYAIIYCSAHVIIAVIALTTNWWWSLATAAITTLAIMIAPDCVGKNIIIELIQKKINCHVPASVALIFNALIFALFVTITCMLPVTWWVKAIIIGVAIILHPIVDYFEGECVIVTDVTGDVISKLTEK